MIAWQKQKFLLFPASIEALCPTKTHIILVKGEGGLLKVKVKVAPE
jgi:hypothetical protein